MKVSELIDKLKAEDPNSEVVLVVYTKDFYEAGYVERIDGSVKYNSVTKMKLEDDESIVELTTSTKAG